ncbi:MAG: hypothetical protein WCJ46_02960 [bacterium]
MSGVEYDENINAQIGIIAGILGFFIAGVISLMLGTKDIVIVLLHASITGAAVMVFVYFVSKLVTVDLTKKTSADSGGKNVKGAGAQDNDLKQGKGRKVDFTIKD